LETHDRRGLQTRLRGRLCTRRKRRNQSNHIPIATAVVVTAAAAAVLVVAAAAAATTVSTTVRHLDQTVEGGSGRERLAMIFSFSFSGRRVAKVQAETNKCL
jgi:hypothetical protein